MAHLSGKRTAMFSDLQRKVLIERNTKHGLAISMRSTYRSWKDARARCRNANNQDYHRYGGRGICFDPVWGDFAKFVADLGERPSGMSLERVNRDGDYTPGNCVWADKFVQANNRSNNRPITAWGRTQNLQAWCNELGLGWRTVGYRLKVGMSPEQALTTEDLRRVR